MWFTLPNSPMTACFLNEKDRAKAVLRVKDNKTGIKNDTWKKSQFIDTITDLQAWMIFLLQLLLNIIQSGSSGVRILVPRCLGGKIIDQDITTVCIHHNSGHGLLNRQNIPGPTHQCRSASHLHHGHMHPFALLQEHENNVVFSRLDRCTSRHRDGTIHFQRPQMDSLHRFLPHLRFHKQFSHALQLANRQYGWLHQKDHRQRYGELPKIKPTQPQFHLITELTHT